MRKIRNITLGGIQQKVFNLVLIMIVLVMAVYSVVIYYQMNHIGGIVTKTGEQQKAAIAAISRETMDRVIAGSLGTGTRMQAQIADNMFSDTADTVNTVADAARMLLEAPERWSAHEVQGPDAALDGRASVQLLTAEGVDPDAPGLAEKLGLIGNLSETMLAVYRNAEVDSCYIALPEGVMLLVG